MPFMLVICLSLAQTCNNHFQEVTPMACLSNSHGGPNWWMHDMLGPMTRSPPYNHYSNMVWNKCSIVMPAVQDCTCTMIIKKWNSVLCLITSTIACKSSFKPTQERYGVQYGRCNKILSFAVDAVGHWMCGKYLLISWVCNLAHSLAALHWLLRFLWQLITHWWICCVDLVNIISGMVRDRSSCRLGSCVHHERFGEPSL